MNPSSPLTRRSILRTGATAGLGALFSGLPQGWIGSAYADDSPEMPDMKFGMIALTDCSSIVVAHEKGLFKKYGINSTVSKGASWAAIRDSLNNGDIQATHMLLGMPIASTMGLGGAAEDPLAKDAGEMATMMAGKKQTTTLPYYTLSGKLLEDRARAGNVRQVTYTFQLSLTTVKDGLAVWEDEKQITKQGKRPSVGF